MRLAAREVEPFLRKPDEKLRGALFFGSDSGLCRELAARLGLQFVADLADPFLVTVLDGAALAREPGRLFDEAQALSLIGGRRVVWIRNAGNRLAAPLKDCFAAAQTAALIICEADGLGPKDALTRLFEAAAGTVAIGCYGDDAGRLARLIDDTLGAAKLRIDSDARRFLLGLLGEDRALSRAELEKLVLYKAGDGSTVNSDDVAACIGDTAVFMLDDVAFACSAGAYDQLAQAIERAASLGAAPVAVLRAVQRHFERLGAVAARSRDPASAKRAAAQLRPPVHFSRVAALVRDALAWSAAGRAAADDRLLAAELACKSTVGAVQPVMRQALFEIARLRGR